MVGGLPGMEAMATTMMKKQMERLDIPDVRELIEMLGAEMYGCRMAMDMFKRTEGDLLPVGTRAPAGETATGSCRGRRTSPRT